MKRGEAASPIGVYLISVNCGEEGEAASLSGVYLISVNPGEEGGPLPDWGLPDFREPWRKGGGGPQPQLRRDPFEPWRKGSGGSCNGY